LDVWTIARDDPGMTHMQTPLHAVSRPLARRLATWLRDDDVAARRSCEVDGTHLELRRHGARP